MSMNVRVCYDQCVSLPQPDQEARRLYERALTTWEQYSGNPDVQDIDDACLASFKRACQEAGMVASASNNCWGYIRAVLKAAAGKGMSVPYLENRWD